MKGGGEQSNLIAMHPRAARIRFVRKLYKLTQEKFAAALSEVSPTRISRGAVGNWELGKGIKNENLALISKRFPSVSMDWLVHGRGPSPDQTTNLPTYMPIIDNQSKTPSSSSPDQAPHNARIGSRVVIDHRIPAYGHAMGGKDGEFVLNGNEITQVLAPSSLRDIPDAYAVFVAGESMEPRYFAGEVVFVNPRVPVRKGDFVVAQILGKPGDAPLAYIKRFVSMSDSTLRLEQFTPPKRLEFPRNKVVSVHRIVMAGDG